MTFYVVAVGQGDSCIIQCPNGKDVLILDMGASFPRFENHTYVNYLLKETFRANQSGKNIHILISHSHTDHYDYFKATLDDDLLPNVRAFIMGGNYTGYNKDFRAWLEQSLGDRRYVINNGVKCFGNSNCSMTQLSTGKLADFRSKEDIAAKKTSDPWQFCSGSSDVTFTVLGANIGTNPNGESVILKIRYQSWSILMSGDFENVTPQKEIMDHYAPSKFKSDYYKVAHHGAWTAKKPNMPALLDLIQPSRVYISQGYPLLPKYHHPNSVTIEHLRNLSSIVEIDPSTNAPFVYWDGDKSDVVTLKGGLNRAIYETCRSIVGEKEVCNDINITSNGHSDSTAYVDVPTKYFITVQ